MQEKQKKVIQKEMDRLGTFRYYSKRTDQLQFTGCPSQKEKSKFVQSL